MATNRPHGLQTQDGRDLATATEATRPGVLLTPPVDIFEDAHAITVLADMPGVTPGQLTIDLHEGVLTITGRGEPLDGASERPVFQEYPAGVFQRSFTLSEAIDQERIQATLKHGVLRLRLPKVDRAKPRQITIDTA
ncbi:MAG TPA: Hsp20/alpha crystallin family protein [Methylomirabilota bacterium]|nr:Hsp20/alpha crystallin family protein [Methylomirabilota bacterium]